MARTIAAAGPIATPPPGGGRTCRTSNFTFRGNALRVLRKQRRPMAKRVKTSGRKVKSKALAGPERARTQEAVLRIAAALDRLLPPASAATDFEAADAFVWHPAAHRLASVVRVNRVEMSLLKLSLIHI